MLGNELDAPLQPRKSRNSDAALQASQGRESLPGPSSSTAHRDENQGNSSRRKSRDSAFGLGGDESGMIETPSGPAMGRRSLNSKEDRTRESQQIPSRDSRDVCVGYWRGWKDSRDSNLTPFSTFLATRRDSVCTSHVLLFLNSIKQLRPLPLHLGVFEGNERCAAEKDQNGARNLRDYQRRRQGARGDIGET